MGKVLNEMKIKISQCQLGCFKWFIIWHKNSSEYNGDKKFPSLSKKGGDIVKEVRRGQKEVDGRLQITIAKSKWILS
jgi:hypothetical protein